MLEDENIQVLKQAYQEAYRCLIHAIASNNQVEALDSLTNMTDIALYYQMYIGKVDDIPLAGSSVLDVSNTLCMWRLEVAVSKASKMTE